MYKMGEPVEATLIYMYKYEKVFRCPRPLRRVSVVISMSVDRATVDLLSIVVIPGNGPRLSLGRR
jgi:hypothetical protein